MKNQRKSHKLQTNVSVSADLLVTRPALVQDWTFSVTERLGSAETPEQRQRRQSAAFLQIDVKNGGA